MVAIIQRREMVDGAVEKRLEQKGWSWKKQRGICGRDAGVGWHVTRQPGGYFWVLGPQPTSAGGLLAETQRVFRGHFSLKTIHFLSTPEGCCLAGASPEAVMGDRGPASGSSAASSPITPPTAWRTVKSLSEIAERRCRNRG